MNIHAFKLEKITSIFALSLTALAWGLPSQATESLNRYSEEAAALQAQLAAEGYDSSVTTEIQTAIEGLRSTEQACDLEAKVSEDCQVQVQAALDQVDQVMSNVNESEALSSDISESMDRVQSAGLLVEEKFRFPRWRRLYRSSGYMDGYYFSFRTRNLRQMRNQCVNFGWRHRVGMVNRLSVNGRYTYGVMTIASACRIVTRYARR